jgi:hypothetical protein
MSATAIRSGIQLASLSLRMALGALVYLWRRATPGYAYQSMIQLFCLTRGRSNDLMACAVGLLKRPYRLPPARGVLGDLGEEGVARVVATLREFGYHVFEQRLPPDMCARLLQFGLSQPCTVRPPDQVAGQPPAAAKVTVYDPANPLGVVYDFDPQDLVNHPDVQALICDPSILGVAQAYVGSRPVLDEINLWWSTAFSSKADANAAQLYHFDMDRIRWLKFFIYLTDVTTRSGPHCFVAGSHRTGGIPAHFLARGYARLPDAEVRAAYPPEALIEFTGPTGTILAEDTRGLHKGKPVLEGHRLVLEFEFSSSMFGATPLKRSRLSTFRTPASQAWISSHRRLYARWLERG